MLDSALTGGKGPVKMWPLAKDPSFAVSAKGANRITSYNVCYTKLLRAREALLRAWAQIV